VAHGVSGPIMISNLFQEVSSFITDSTQFIFQPHVMPTSLLRAWFGCCIHVDWKCVSQTVSDQMQGRGSSKGHNKGNKESTKLY
jgi:hypothetical protein